MADLVEGPTENDVLALVSVEQLKMQKRIVTGRENDFIKDCILDAWAWIDGPDGKCRRAVLPQKWAIVLPAWPQAGLRLSVHGARAITRISSTVSGAPAVDVDPSAYFSRLTSDGIDLEMWFRAPATLPVLSAGDSLRVEFDAGWPSKDTVPRQFRRALRLIAAHFYDNREETYGDQRVSVVSRRIELGAEDLLKRFIVPLDYGRRC